MTQNAVAEVRCPYCGLEQYASVKASHAGAENLIRCDVEDRDGCDRLFVAVVKVQHVSTTYKVESDAEVAADYMSRTVVS